jgi:hypothetical protein
MTSVNDTGPAVRGVDGRAARAVLVSRESRQSREAGLRRGVAALRRAEGANQDEPVTARPTVGSPHSG